MIQICQKILFDLSSCQGRVIHIDLRKRNVPDRNPVKCWLGIIEKSHDTELYNHTLLYCRLCAFVKMVLHGRADILI
jgi:hypothetical protein